MSISTIRHFAARRAAAAALALALLAPAAVTAQDMSAAATQEAILKALTVENLIGDAVSLSNQEYPDVEKAIQRFKNNDMEGAREFLDLARTKYPKLPPTDLSLAKLNVIIRNGPSARLLLEKTVTEFPNDPEAYLILADFAFSDFRTTEAHAVFEKARALTEKFTENDKRKQNFQIRVLAGLSAVYERRQQWQAAKDLLTQWVGLDPDSAAAHQRLGVTQFRLKDPKAAYEEFKKARDLRPDSQHPYVLLGQLYTQDSDVEKARTSFERAYQEDQKNEQTAQAYAEWLIQQNNLDKAQQVAAAMRKAAPDSLRALLLEGVVSKMRGQPKAGEEALLKVLQIEPGNASATNLLALILAESTNAADQEKALGYAQMNAQRFANNPQANITLAWVLHKMGRGTEAEQVLARSGQSNLNADSAYLVAQIMVARNQKENARRVLDQVLDQAGAGMFLYKKEAEALLKELGGPIDGTSLPVAVPESGGSPSPQTNPAAPPAGGSTTEPATGKQ